MERYPPVLPLFSTVWGTRFRSSSMRLRQQNRTMHSFILAKVTWMPIVAKNLNHRTPSSFANHPIEHLRRTHSPGNSLSEARLLISRQMSRNTTLAPQKAAAFLTDYSAQAGLDFGLGGIQSHGLDGRWVDRHSLSALLP